MCFAWIMQRLVSSRRPTKYAYAASCRIKWHMPWSKYHIFPLLGLFCRLNMRKAVYELGGQYFFGTSRSCRKPLSLASTSGHSSLSWPLRIPSRDLASHSQSELLSGWLLPMWHWWPGLHNHLGQLLGWQRLWWPPTSSNFSASTFLLSISPRVGGASTSGTGDSSSAGGSTDAECTCVLTFQVFPSSPFLGIIFVCAILE